MAQIEASDTAEPEAVISAETDTTESDQKIESRLENIFSELNALSAVTVSVKEGVVILGGEVANEASAQQAQRLAVRLAGVVTVENEISRTLAVADNVQPVIEGFQKSILNFTKALPLIGLALLVVLAAVFLGSFLSRRSSLWQKLAPNPFLSELLAQAVRLAILLLGVILALNLLGASSVITTILGGAGVLGLAIGFAVRDTIENYISSIMLSLRQPFRAKDHVVINGLEGIVMRLTSRATILMTLEGNHLRIPNSSVFKGVIVNYSTNPARRFDFDLGVDADDNPVAGMKAGLAAIQTLDFILDDPEPFALIKTVGDSNIVLSFYGWIDQRVTNFAKARSLSIQVAMSALVKQDFTLPEPVYRLRFDPEINAALIGSFRDQADSTTISEMHEAKAKPPEDRKNVGGNVGGHVGEDVRNKVNDDALDVSPSNDLEQIVEAEIESERRSDLLDKDVPHE